MSDGLRWSGAGRSRGTPARGAAAWAYGGMVVCGLGLVVAFVAGCGAHGGGGVATAVGGNRAAATATPDPSAPAADPAQRQRQFAQCMRDHGVDVPDPEAGKGPQAGAEVDKQAAQAALVACRPFMPDGGDLSPPSATELDALRAFAVCLRAHGVPDFPDPDPATGQPAFANLDQARAMKRDPHLQDAVRACQDLAPTPSSKDGGKG